MKKWILLLLAAGLSGSSSAQMIVFDRDHFLTVNENGMVRISAEMATHNYYDSIHERLSDIKINIGALVLTEELIYRSLTQVDQGMKSILAVKEISTLIAEIFSETDQMIAFASKHPHLLLFAEQVSSQLRQRGAALVENVSSVVLSEKSDLLLNFEKRDALLKKISLELRVIRALVYSMRKSMYWASQRSLFSQLNPFRNFINIDRQLVLKIINNYKTLKK
ncbi:hypothetical protein OQZ29_02885 [Pedobacter agri]|uniref:Plasmid transfer protein n=1 Tax=Pedobacter agri TaxID=454586 RepID=A0A9X3DAN8_9SPHI|nr:hypothetical protein [Pedobacter agri]MCX3263671.1 hypothetical protein [Pedobacter agri]